MLQLSTIKLCAKVRGQCSCNDNVLNDLFRTTVTHGQFDMGYSESTFSKYAFGREEGDLVSCTGRASTAGRAGPQPMVRAGPGLNNILRAGPGAGLKLEGPGRARACKY